LGTVTIQGGVPYVFSSFIVCYLFFAGMGSGAFVVAAVAAALSHRRASSSEGLDMRTSAVVLGASDRPDLLGTTDPLGTGLSTERARGLFALIIAAFCMVLAAVLLLCDFGDPLRTWRVVLTPFASIVSFGANVLILFTGLAVLLALVALCQVRLPRPISLCALAIGTLLALATMAYTGFLLAGMVSIDVWRTWLVPLLFVASSFSCGVAVVLFFETLYLSLRAEGLKAQWRVLLVLSLIEAVVLAGFLAERAGFSPTAQESILLLLAGEQALAFWGGVVGIGLILPFVIHLLFNWIPIDALVLVASASVLVGGFLIRYCVVGIGLFSPILPMA
jgi:formate-dependent nitrite reductase membrane component NrfD